MPNTTTNIIHIVRRALSGIDARLVDHGAQVAYIAAEIAAECPEYAFDADDLLVLCGLHDIGAYKTEEIDDMLRFESRDVLRHAAYGSLFLKHTSGLCAQADAILYHHTPYTHIPTDCAYAHYANIIFLADRVAVLVNAGASAVLSQVAAQVGTLFDPMLVRALMRAERKHGVLEAVVSGGYLSVVEGRISALSVSSTAAQEYLRMLVHAIDFRSEHTVTHTANTVSFAMQLAERLKLSPQDKAMLAEGAFLHDVGKITTPVAILEKPGKLTDAEMTVMRRHVEITEEFLRGNVEDGVCDIAARHHEKMNGKGYPRGLTGAQLTLPERILAVADIMSALHGRRSYKEAFGKAQILEALGAMLERGELDSRVCAALFADYDAILAQVVLHEQDVRALYQTIREEYAALYKRMQQA